MAEQKPKRGGAKAKEELATKAVVENAEPTAQNEPEANKPEVKSGKSEKIEAKVLREHKIQLDIHRPSFYQVVNKGAKLVVKNEGYGNAYVSDNFAKVGDKDQLIITGGGKVFEGVELVHFESASQPVLSFTEIE